MVRAVLLLPLGFLAVNAFTGQPLVSRTPAAQSSLYMGGAGGYATSLDGKKEKVAQVKELLDKSQMVFSVPASVITVAQMQTLRRSLPEGSVASVVKNTIMNRAIDGTEFEAASSILTGANMWFFIEDDIGATMKAWKAFVKETSKQETHAVIGGVIEGVVYDAKGVEAIGNLPSKDELYAKIAGSIKAVPTKVARVIKAPNSKLARAIKLATMPEE
jgi:large subunit ribosomal protein L10